MLIEYYDITHHTSTVAHLYGNGQAKATNKTLLHILSKMRTDYKGTWDEKLPLVLWAYRKSRRKAIGFTPFSLVYGAEIILAKCRMVVIFWSS